MAEPPINPASKELWRRFTFENEHGLRSKAADSMDGFIRSLSAPDRTAFSRWFCMRRYERRHKWVMHSHLMPLARKLIVPVLLGGARQGDPQLLRWLARVISTPTSGPT